MPSKSKRVQQELRRVVDRLVAKFDPERIILFGSRARGRARTDSDLDLLVVMAVPGSKREKQLEVRRALPRTTVPVDVIVTRPEDYSWRKEVVGTIEWPAAHEGKVLHVRF